MKVALRTFLAGLAAVALVVLVHCGIDEVASRRAQRARAALRPGAACADVVVAAERFANADSVVAARQACQKSETQQVVLNFSLGWSLNYLMTVDLAADGSVRAVSPVGAW